MADKNFHKNPAATFNLKAFEIDSSKHFLIKENMPRSVCDSKRDRLRGKDPMAEEELQ